MHILLPPSETKTPGGEPGTVMELSSLTFPRLTDIRTKCLSTLEALAEDRDASVAALKLGPRNHDEVEKNRRLLTSPALPAVDRFTGVLYDAFDVAALGAEKRRLVAQRVLIHTAHLGPVGAADEISDYRLSATARIPGLPLVSTWRDAVCAALSELEGVVIDMRSKAYEALGPVPEHPQRARLAVVREGPDGVRSAVGHFNKRAKGLLARALATSDDEPTSLDEVCRSARDAGFALHRAGPQQLDLVVA